MVKSSWDSASCIFSTRYPRNIRSRGGWAGWSWWAEVRGEGTQRTNAIFAASFPCFICVYLSRRGIIKALVHKWQRGIVQDWAGLMLPECFEMVVVKWLFLSCSRLFLALLRLIWCSGWETATFIKDKWQETWTGKWWLILQ